MRFDSIGSGLARVVSAISALLLVSIVVVALSEIFFRYIIEASLVWSVEINRFLFIWLAFFAASGAVYHRLHFRMALARRFLSPRGQARLEAGVDAVVLGFAVVMLTQAWDMVGRTTRQLSTALQLPIAYVYMAMVTSGILMIAFVLLHWAAAFQAGKLPVPMDHGPGEEHSARESGSPGEEGQSGRTAKA